MENASKALMMAGGILIALLVVGALLLMFNQVSYYQQSENNSEKNKQLNEFNKTFLKYTDSDIKGNDLISVINKVIDFNKKDAVNNSVDYDRKITLEIKELDRFNQKYAYSNESNKVKLFDKDSIKISSGSSNVLDDKLTKILSDCSQAESKVGINVMKKAANCYNKNDTEAVNINNIRNILVENCGNSYSRWKGKTTEPTYETIIKYRQYADFKISVFESIDSEIQYYDNGQIKNISFKFKK